MARPRRELCGREGLGLAAQADHEWPLAQSHSGDEANVRRVYVEHADWVLARDPETVFGAGRRREERPWTTAPPLPVHEELNLAFQHVERVCVIVMDVGINTLPARFKNSVDDLEVGKFSEQPVRSALRLKPLAFVRRCEERFHHADHGDVVMHAQTRPPAGRRGQS